MNEVEVLDISREAIFTLIKVVSPVLLAVQREIDHEMTRIHDIADAFEQSGESYTAAMVIRRYLDIRHAGAFRQPQQLLR